MRFRRSRRDIGLATMYRVLAQFESAGLPIDACDGHLGVARVIIIDGPSRSRHGGRHNELIELSAASGKF